MKWFFFTQLAPIENFWCNLCSIDRLLCLIRINYHPSQYTMFVYKIIDFDHKIDRKICMKITDSSRKIFDLKSIIIPSLIIFYSKIDKVESRNYKSWFFLFNYLNILDWSIVLCLKIVFHFYYFIISRNFISKLE